MSNGFFIEKTTPTLGVSCVAWDFMDETSGPKHTFKATALLSLSSEKKIYRHFKLSISSTGSWIVYYIAKRLAILRVLEDYKNVNKVRAP